jgi:hypothetical protein
MKLLLLLLVGTSTLISSCTTTNTIATWEKPGLEPREYSKLFVYVNASTIPKKSTLEFAIAQQFANAFLESVTATNVAPALVIDSTITFPNLRVIMDSIRADLLLIVDYEKKDRPLAVSTSTTVDVSVSTDEWTPSHSSSSTNSGPTAGALAVSKLFDKNGLLMIVETGSEVSDHANLRDVGKEIGKTLIREFDQHAIILTWGRAPD